MVIFLAATKLPLMGMESDRSSIITVAERDNASVRSTSKSTGDSSTGVPDDRNGSVNGGRSDQSNITLDGADVNQQNDRAAFTSDLVDAVTKLVSRYHDESSPAGRAHRLVVVAYPVPHEPNN